MFGRVSIYPKILRGESNEGAVQRTFHNLPCMYAYYIRKWVARLLPLLNHIPSVNTVLG